MAGEIYISCALVLKASIAWIKHSPEHPLPGMHLGTSTDHDRSAKAGRKRLDRHFSINPTRTYGDFKDLIFFNVPLLADYRIHKKQPALPLVKGQ